MTEKRFELRNSKIDYTIQCEEISDNKNWITYGEIVDLLNQLNDENEQLKQEIRNLRDFRGFITEQNVSNEKEKKNLQLQMLRLYNYFENYFEDNMSPAAFSEMWDNVKEDKKWEKRN